jgi:O-antigen/teichoic acid export membrane protein
LQQGLLSCFPRLAQGQQARLLGMAIGVYVVVSAGLIGALALFPCLFLPVFSGQSSLPFLQLTLLFLFLHLPTLLNETLYLLLKKPWELFAYGVLSFGLQVLVVLLPAFWAWGLEAIVQGLLALALLKALWLLGILGRFGTWGWDGNLMQQWWRASAYLMVYAAISGLIVVSNAWMVNWYYGGDARQFALFRYGARELPLSLALVTGLNTVIVPRVVENLATALPEIRRRSTRLMHFLFPFSALLLLSSQWWFTWVFNAEFLESRPVFNTYLLLVVSRVVFSFPILNAFQDRRIAIMGALSEALFNVVLIAIFLPLWGILGVAIANFFSYALEKAIYCWHLQRRYQISVSAYLQVPLWGMYTLALIFLWVLQFRNE